MPKEAVTTTNRKNTNKGEIIYVVIIGIEMEGHGFWSLEIYISKMLTYSGFQMPPGLSYILRVTFATSY